MNKLVLVIPNFRWQKADESARWHVIPYNICLLAAMVRDLCSITIFDANTENLTQEEFKAKLQAAAPDVIGITVMMDQFAISGHCTAKLARESCSKSVILMGGVYATINYDKAVLDANVDYIVRGEGEHALREFLLHLWKGAPFPKRGFVWRSDKGNIECGTLKNGAVIQERSDFISDLNSLPLPAYDLVDFKKYTLSAPRRSVDGPYEFPFVRIQTSRGCPQGCCFCQVKEISGNRFRPRSPENIINEIRYFRDNYGVCSLIFDDDNIVTQRSRAVKLFTLLRDEIKLPWKAIAMAVFKLDEELLGLMAASGCKYMSIAIESGSPRILKDIIRKPVDLNYAKRMTAYAKGLGIFVSANFIIGFPTETWDEVRSTCAFAEELDADYVKIFTAIPLRHTRLWDLCEATGSFTKDFDQMNISWNAGQISSAHFSSRELTLLRAYEWDRINFATPEKRTKIRDMMRVTDEELEDIRKQTRASAMQRV